LSYFGALCLEIMRLSIVSDAGKYAPPQGRLQDDHPRAGIGRSKYAGRGIGVRR